MKKAGSKHMESESMDSKYRVSNTIAADIAVSEPPFNVEPAYAQDPGVTVTEHGVIISAVLRGQDPCGLILYHIPDGTIVRVPFTDNYRFGNLHSVKISPLDSSLWCYRLYRGEISFVDPCCRSLTEIETAGETILTGGFFYRSDDKLPPGRAACRWDGKDPSNPFTFIYTLHVKGFTQLADGLTSKPGTFSAVAEMSPYLKDLGATAVELMPVYELQPDSRIKDGPRTMEDALALYPVSRNGFPLRDLTKEKENYWGYGRGYYFALKGSLSTPGYEGGPQKEFTDMVQKFHASGIDVYLQLFFPDSVSYQTQAEIVRFYVTHYDVDGFRLMGSVADIRAISSDPLLADIRLFHTDFPFAQIVGTDAENPESGEIQTGHLFSCSNRFSNLIRRFVKSDDNVMREFLYDFLKVPQGHGNVHYVCGTDGFTLRDLVSYNEKHNEDNGEGGTDGFSENFSWNCGEEGDSDDEEVLRLRRNQIRNFLTLLFLSQSTPMLRSGDENYNTQYGNNNPYCQDNETGWTKWDNGEEGARIREFVKAIVEFKKAHPVFTKTAPFKNTDYLGCGYPDLSLHGNDAWKPDLGETSHSIGICLCENYDASSGITDLIYLAINMHWETLELGLPKLSPGRRWNLLVDTALEDSFISAECIMDDQRMVEVAPRSIRILNTVTSSKPIRRRKKKEKAAAGKESEMVFPKKEAVIKEEAVIEEGTVITEETVINEETVITEETTAFKERNGANEKE